MERKAAYPLLAAGEDGDDKFYLESGGGAETVSGGETGETGGDIIDTVNLVGPGVQRPGVIRGHGGGSLRSGGWNGYFLRVSGFG